MVIALTQGNTHKHIAIKRIVNGLNRIVIFKRKFPTIVKLTGTKIIGFRIPHLIQFTDKGLNFK